MKAVLFDLDGVIINSEFVVKAAFTLSYNEIVSNGQAPVDEYMHHMGDSFANIMRKMSLPLEIEKPFKKYSRNLLGLVTAYKDINKLLEFLKNQEIIMAIATGKDRARTIETLKKLEIYDYFQLIIAGDDVKNPKPSPEPVNTIIDTLNLNRDECIFVGDSPNDIKAAQNADVESCAVTWGFTNKEVLMREKPDYIIDSPIELIKLVEKESEPMFSMPN